MPSSFVDSVPNIIHGIIEYGPRKIVDVGPGWGKYGLMCREYLGDLDWLDAVEVPPGRYPTQDAIYDHIFECDARTFAGWSAYDLVLLIDVIEHMSKADGHVMLERMRLCGAAVLLSTPKVFIEQHDPHNPFEDHQCLWEWPDFDGYTVMKDLSTVDAIIYLLR